MSSCATEPATAAIGVMKPARNGGAGLPHALRDGALQPALGADRLAQQGQLGHEFVEHAAEIAAQASSCAAATAAASPSASATMSIGP